MLHAAEVIWLPRKPPKALLAAARLIREYSFLSRSRTRWPPWRRPLLPHSNPAPSFLQDQRDPHSVRHSALKVKVVYSLPKEFQRTLTLRPIKEEPRFKMKGFSQHTKCWRSSSNLNIALKYRLERNHRVCLSFLSSA